MPFTPFHFGPSTCVALFFHKKLDIPVFLLANIIIDLEPLLVLNLNLAYPLHGLAHSFLGATLLGAVWGCIAFAGKDILIYIMKTLKLNYHTTIKKVLLAGVLGSWFHIILDAPLYADIKPFYPYKLNPFYGLLSDTTMYLLCSFLFLPALLCYFYVVRNSKLSHS